MTVFVLDNSVTMRWCFQNASHPYAHKILQQLTTGEAFVAVLWRYEVSAVLAKSERDNLLAPGKADAFIALLGSLNITLDDEGADRILTDVHQLAVAHRLTSYDAAYLELAIRRKLPLATLDDELIRACKTLSHPLL